MGIGNLLEIFIMFLDILSKYTGNSFKYQLKYKPRHSGHIFAYKNVYFSRKVVIKMTYYLCILNQCQLLLWVQH